VTLFLYIHEDPRDAEAHTDAQLLGEFALQISDKERKGGFKISSLLKASLGLERIAIDTVNRFQNDETLDAVQDDALKVSNATPSHSLELGSLTAVL
jgi:hypothetical protein